ncbi:MAG: DedA family protein [Dehalococcoidia bacterium]|nr:MAG: DedA family protein [Dehalococcoidia bacterium]
MDLERLIEWGGYTVLVAMVFAESGLFVGFLLPGDSLLIAAGVVAQRGHLDLKILIPLLIIAAITGDATGYTIGRRAGPLLFAREDARFFKRRYMEEARAFFDRHGGKAITISRFMAIIRSFVPSVAGAVGMPYAKFTAYNVVGGVLWVLSMTFAGYFIGEAAAKFEYVLIAVVILISFIPLMHFIREQRRH